MRWLCGAHMQQMCSSIMVYDMVSGLFLLAAALQTTLAVGSQETRSRRKRNRDCLRSYHVNSCAYDILTLECEKEMTC